VQKKIFYDLNAKKKQEKKIVYKKIIPRVYVSWCDDITVIVICGRLRPRDYTLLLFQSKSYQIEAHNTIFFVFVILYCFVAGAGASQQIEKKNIFLCV